ncbi:MAG: hypothetical protein ACM3O2_00150 [Syntrophothermus sp.]
MAEFKKFAKRRLPPPPPPEDASTTLQEPEVAPAAAAPAPKESEQKKIDARTLRKTGRTIQFATRVTERFDRQFRAVAKRDNVMLATLLELALEAYENNRKQGSR